MKLIGMEHKVASTIECMKRRQATILYGPTGSGKTMIAWEAAKAYAKDAGIDVIYLQLYPEMTKNSLIGGETIENGTIVIKEQAILSIGGGKKGAIFIVDECTHTTEPVLLAFNSLVEEPYSTVVGKKIYELNPQTRFIFCGNFPDHAGNIHLPISFANRMFIITTELPDESVLYEIGKEVTKDCASSSWIPKEMIKFIADLIVKTHEPAFPISPRNMVIAIKAMGTLYDTGYNKTTKCIPPKALDAICKSNNINQELLKETILSSTMAHIVAKSQGPERVKALLW